MFTHCISHCCCIKLFSTAKDVLCSHSVSLTVVVLSSTAKAVLCVHTLYLSLLLYRVVFYSQRHSVCSHTVSLTAIVLSCFLQPKTFCVFTYCISHCCCIELFSTAKDILCVHILYLSLLLYWVVFYSQRHSVCSQTVSLTAVVLSCFLQPKTFCVFTHCISHCCCIELFSATKGVLCVHTLCLSLLLYWVVFYSQSSSVCSHTVSLTAVVICIELFSTAKDILCVHTLYLSLLLYWVVFYNQRHSVCSHTVSLTAVVLSCFLQPKTFCVFTHCISHCCCIELFSTAKDILCVHTLYLSLLLYRVVFYSQRRSVCSHTVSLTAVVSSCFLQPKTFCVFTHCISHCCCIELFSTAKDILCVHILYLSLLLYRVVFYSQRRSVCSHTVSLTAVVLSCFLQPKEFCAMCLSPMFAPPPPPATPCPVYVSVSFLNNDFSCFLCRVHHCHVWQPHRGKEVRRLIFIQVLLQYFLARHEPVVSMFLKTFPHLHLTQKEEKQLLLLK